MTDADPTAPRERPRTLAEAKDWMLDRAARHIHPMNNLSLEDTAGVVNQLEGLDPVNWAAAWRPAGEAAWAEAEAAEAAGDLDAARKHYMRAHGFFFLGRFPCPNHPDKMACHVREREAYLKAGALFENPVTKITVPFAGREGEGKEVSFLYRRPAGVERPPVIVMWGGVDAWKEQMTAACELALSRGFATIAMDGPGTGESPVRGVPDAERQFLPVLDWIAVQDDLAPSRPGCLGRSFGGYWATRLAYLHKDRIAAAVNWGGGAHYMFQRDWILASRHPESYLMELVETRMMMLGAQTEEEYAQFFERLSLLDQGLLDQPNAPLLLVNGRFDQQCPVADIDLLLDHGEPKAVRMFPGGHMGLTPKTLPTIMDWLCKQVAKEAGL